MSPRDTARRSALGRTDLDTDSPACSRSAEAHGGGHRRHRDDGFARIDRTVVVPGARELAIVMLEPSLLGLVAALVMANAIRTVADAVVGLLIFGGSETATVVLLPLKGPTRTRLGVVGTVDVLVVVSAVVSALAAPTLAVVVVVVFGVSAAVAGLPSLTVVGFDRHSVAMTTVAALVGVGFAATVALVQPWFATRVSLARFRIGSGVALVLSPRRSWELSPLPLPSWRSSPPVCSRSMDDAPGTSRTASDTTAIICRFEYIT